MNFLGILPGANSGHMGLLLQVVIIFNSSLFNGSTYYHSEKAEQPSFSGAQHKMFTAVPYHP